MKEVIKTNENTWRIEDGMVRFYLLCGNEKAALIDSGMNCPDAKQTAQELTDLPLILINTHADRDHISGISAFSDFYMSPNEEENLRAHNAQGKILPIHEGDVIDLGGRELLIVDFFKELINRGMLFYSITARPALRISTTLYPPSW